MGDAARAGRAVVAAVRRLTAAAERFPLSGGTAIDGHDLRGVHTTLGLEAALELLGLHVNRGSES